jgi:hypothetical protein
VKRHSNLSPRATTRAGKWLNPGKLQIQADVLSQEPAHSSEQQITIATIITVPYCFAERWMASA